MSTMSAPEIVQLWMNCLREMKNPHNPDRQDAEAILNWIRRDWTRRINENDFFVWPKTDAEPGRKGIDSSDWLNDGMLKYLGYSVGRTLGVRAQIRQLILVELFEGPALPAFPQSYLAEWGNPTTSRRLKKMATTIASLTRNAKRKRSAIMNDAVRDWESDLKFLYDTFYVGRFGFAWPATEIG